MYCCKIFQLNEQKTKLLLISTHFYTTKEKAVCEAIKCVPKNETLNWTSSDQPEDVAFYFDQSKNSQFTRFQFIISKAIIDQPIGWFKYQESILIPDSVFGIGLPTSVINALRNE